MFVTTGLTATGTANQAHIMTGPYKTGHIDWPIVAASEPSPTVDQMWLFGSAADAFIDDPLRPTRVLGASGPWDISLTTVDPFGNAMAHAGVKFVLQPGGVPFNAADPNQVFFHTFHPFDDTQPYVVTDIFRFADGRWVTQSGSPFMQWEQPIPTNLTPMQVQEYVWDHRSEFTITPAPASLFLLGIGCMMRGRRR
jgi:hypothetical protein